MSSSSSSSSSFEKCSGDQNTKDPERKHEEQPLASHVRGIMPLEEILRLGTPQETPCPTPDEYKKLVARGKARKKKSKENAKGKKLKEIVFHTDPAMLAEAAEAKGIKDSDIIYPYMNWDGIDPPLKTMINRVHSRAWHYRLDRLEAQGCNPLDPLARGKATMFAKSATDRYRKLFPQPTAARGSLLGVDVD